MNETMPLTVFCVLLLGCIGAAGQGQAQFEVASVKASSNPGRALTSTTPVSLTMRNSSLSNCIRWAYGVKDYQISGNASWISVDRYDVSAKTAQAATEAEMKAMLQGLLADRFKLTFHREQKEMQALVVTVGKGGPKFHESTGEGESSLNSSSDVLTGKRAGMAELMTMIEGAVRVPVVDLTGLTGRYDFTIDPRPYLPDGGPGAASQVDRASIVISIFQEELGLKVESKKMPVDVLVIDRAEKPSEN